MMDSNVAAASMLTNDRIAMQKALWKLVLDNVTNGKVKGCTEQLINLLSSDDTNHKEAADTLYRAVEGLSTEEKFELCDIAGLLVHIQRSASITAAHADSRLAKDYGQNNNELFRTVGLLKNDRHLSIADAQAAIAKPVFDQVLTAHPTYIGDLDYTKALGALDEAIAQGEMNAASTAIGELLQRSTVVPSRMKVQDEVQLIKHFLSKAYDTIPALYTQLDQAFAQHFPKDGTGIAQQHYDPLNTKLNINFQSWGLSGDKDGNVNVNVHTTEDAVKTCRKTICHLYQDDLRLILLALGEDPSRQALRNECIEMHQMLNPISHNTMATPPEDIKNTLNALRGFSEKLYRAMQDGTSPEQQAIAQRALGMRRNIDIFGLGLAQIEYREDAGMLKNVLSNIIAETGTYGYANKEDDARENILDGLLAQAATPEGLKQLQANKDMALIKVPRNAKSRQFNYADTNKPDGNQGILYHTIKRLELAARNPDMFKGQVLAEASSPLQFKEMLLLLKLTGNEHVRIIPLFEEPTELKNVGATIETIIKDPHVRSYLLRLGLAEWQAKAEKGLAQPLGEALEAQINALADGADNQPAVEAALAEKGLKLADILSIQVQLAHSDNSRRGGVPGARTAVYKAHNDLREVTAKYGMGIQFFEGGSHTDSFRMGTRSYSSLNNTYGSHDFMKSTVQGMDIVQLFSNPITLCSFIGENIANAAEHLSRKLSPKQGREGESDIQSQVEDALIGTIDGYKRDYFEDPRLGYVMEQVFDYSFNQACGTIASRSAKRTSSKSASKKEPIYMDPVSGTRTIGYSEAAQHSFFNPSFVGCRGVHEKLHAIIGEQPTMGIHAARVSGAGAATSPEAALHELYEHEGKALKDDIDHIAYSVAMTDFDRVWDSVAHDYKLGTQNLKRMQFDAKHHSLLGESESVKRPETLEELAQVAQQKDTIAGFLAALEMEYREAALLSYEALTGKPLIGHEEMSTNELRAKVREHLPMYHDQFKTADIMLGLADAIEHSTSRQAMMQAFGKNGGEKNVVNGLGKALHALRDAILLVRPPMRSEWRNQGIAQEREPEIAMI